MTGTLDPTVVKPRGVRARGVRRLSRDLERYAALHTPLMSVTNAISSVIIVGAILAAGPSEIDFGSALGAVAVALCGGELAGGFQPRMKHTEARGTRARRGSRSFLLRLGFFVEHLQHALDLTKSRRPRSPPQAPPRPRPAPSRSRSRKVPAARMAPTMITLEIALVTLNQRRVQRGRNVPDHVIAGRTPRARTPRS